MFGFLNILGKEMADPARGRRGGRALLARTAAGRRFCRANGTMCRPGRVEGSGAASGSWTACEPSWRSTSGPRNSSKPLAGATFRQSTGSRRKDCSPGRRPSSFAACSAGPMASSCGDRRQLQAPGLGTSTCRYVALHFFQYRQTELLLRPFVDEKSTRFPWKEVHDVYKLTQSRELAQPLSRSTAGTPPNAMDTMLEREYIHVLLQDIMNGGHFRRIEALWVMRGHPALVGAVVLNRARTRLAEHRFVVDLDSDAGIARSNANRRHGHASVSTRRRVAQGDARRIRDAARCTRQRRSTVRRWARSQRRRILAKLNVALRQRSGRSSLRRGERKPTALTVDVAVGLPQILDAGCATKRRAESSWRCGPRRRAKT